MFLILLLIMMGTALVAVNAIDSPGPYMKEILLVCLLIFFLCAYGMSFHVK
jgi:hypothetical protein